MILADKILMLRKKNGWSQEDLAEKLDVSRQSISKWEGAIAIPDINRIIDMAKLFGVTTDYLLKDDIDEEIYSTEDDSSTKKVLLAEANNYIVDTKKYGKMIALGTLLCILSPTILILLAGLCEIYNFISEEASVAIGLAVLFIMVSIAIAIFILSSSKMRKYDFITKNEFELEYGASSVIKERKESYLNKFNLYIVISIMLLILGVLPLIITAVIDASDMVIVSMVDVLIMIAAISVYHIVSSVMYKNSFDRLLREDDFEKDRIIANEKTDKFSGFYWPIITAIYLCWSFITFDWNITWIVWPIAALLYAAILAIIMNAKDNK